MNFLLAKKTLAEFRGGEQLPLMLAMSGTSETLALYVRAMGAMRGRDIQLHSLPFNTLNQALLQPPPSGYQEVMLLTPWDLVPHADWRSGLPNTQASLSELRTHAEGVCALIAQRSRSKILYLPATLMPILGTSAENEALAIWLQAQVLTLNARILDPKIFGLSSYLSIGCPVASASLGTVAETIIETVLSHPRNRCKVLVTDLDNVMWSGVIAEDGMDGVAFRPESRGYKHFVYQTLVRQLKEEGVLIAAVSRNDAEVALGPLRSGELVLRETDFVSVVASYEAKSSQIAMLADQLNLGLDSFVFVDDSPLELAEVTERLPMVTTLAFPSRDDELPALLSALRSHFPRTVITAEDRERTELYRRRLAGMAPSHARGADLTAFLRDLKMELIIYDRSRGDRSRAVELINKTNQFNLNGHRVTNEEVGAVLTAGGRLLTASLHDRHGAHGEILACLLTAEGTIASLVMSCRVFQRRVEHAFFLWLSEHAEPIRELCFVATSRNQPIQDFINNDAFVRDSNGSVYFSADKFAEKHAAVSGILSVRFDRDRALIPI